MQHLLSVNIIMFTDAGRQILVDASYVKKEIETEYAALLGEERMRELRSILQELLRDEN